MREGPLVTTPRPSQAQTLQGGGGRRSLRGQDQPHPQVRGRPPLPPSTAVRPAWEAQSQVTAETVWPLGGGAGNWGDSRRAESVASREPGDGQAVPLPPCQRAWASPHPDPHLWPLAAAASATELLLAAPSACGPSLWPPTWPPRAGGLPVACSPHTWPLTASRVPQVLQECLRP